MQDLFKAPRLYPRRSEVSLLAIAPEQQVGPIADTVH